MSGKSEAPRIVMTGDSASGRPVVIDGVELMLPPDARHIMQDRRGIWYYSSKQPRVTNSYCSDWFMNKTPIIVLNEDGHPRALKTPPAERWQETAMPVPIARGKKRKKAL